MKARAAVKPKRIPLTNAKVTPHKRIAEPFVVAKPGSSYNAIMEIVKWADSLPPDTWEGIPDDLSKQSKHYLYGSPRIPE